MLNTDEYERSLDNASKKTETFGDKLKNGLSSATKAVTALKAVSATAIGVLAKIGLDYNSQMEQYTTNFTTMLGNQEAAIQKVNELKAFAASTPLSMEDLATGTQTLLAFGVASESSTEVLRQLGDISLGNADKMERLATAFGKATAQGKLTGEIVQQMIDAGWNPLIQISESAGETMEETQKRMSAGAVSVQELQAAMEAVTSGTGQFSGGMEAASHTMAGMLSTLKDNSSALIGSVVQPLSDLITSVVLPASIEVVGVLQSIVDGTSDLMPLVSGLTVLFGGLAAAMMIQKAITGFQQAQVAISLLTMEVGKANLAQAALNGTMTVWETIVALLTGKITLAQLATALWTKVQIGLNVALTANPIGAVVVAVAALVAAVTAAVVWIRKLKGESEETAEAEIEQAEGAESLALSTDDLTKSIEAAILAEQDEADALEDLRETTLDLSDANDILSDALKEQKKNGSLSLDTALKLIDAGYSAAIAIDEETGAVTLNKDSYIALTNAKIDDQITALETQKQAQITAAKLEAEAMAALGGGRAYYELAAAKLYAEKSDTSAIDVQIANLERLRNNLGNVSLEVVSSSRAAKTQAELDLETYKALKSRLDHEKNMEVVSEREYYQKLITLRDNYLADSANLSEYEKVTEQIYKYNDGLVNSMSKTVKSMAKDWDEYQKEFSNRSKEIFNSYKLFEEVPERQKVSGQQLINSLQGQISNIQEFYDGLAKLSERGISDAMIEDIRGMGVGAVDQLSALLSLSDDKLSEYADLYAEKQKVANKYAADELEDLRNETVAKIQGNLDELQSLYDEQTPIVGAAFTDGLADGIINGMSSVIDSAVNVAQAAVDSTKEVLGIHSPSRVFAGIGSNMALGLAEGWEDEFANAKSRITSGMDFGTANVDFASSAVGQSSAAIVNSVAGGAGVNLPTIQLAINLLTGDARPFAQWILPDLIAAADAAGTPIASGQYA